jgi:DNA-binding LacI/PurR family transcriptional regulator
VPTVIVDQQYGTRLAIEHLLNLGHQQIAFVCGPPLWSASKERRKGWAKALRHVGLQLGPCIEGDWSAESGFAAAVKLLDRQPRDFTAIVAANDHMALGVLRALHAKGIRVPERCVEILLSMIKRQTFDPGLHLLRPALVIRESTSVAGR